MPLDRVDTVFVLGAGFTRAFLPQALLLIDDYGADSILSQFDNLPHIKRIVDLEKALHRAVDDAPRRTDALRL